MPGRPAGGVILTGEGRGNEGFQVIARYACVPGS